MATQNLYIPSSSGSYKCGAGDVRLRIYYACGSTVSTTFDSPFEFIGKLQFDFSQRPGDLKATLSSCKVRFYNRNNIWETHAGGNSIFSHASDKNQIFLDIIIDGSVFWSGLLDILSVCKDSYHYKTSLNYTWLQATFVDKVRVLEQYTLNDAGVVDGDTAIGIITKFAALTDFGSVNTTYLDFDWEEVNGNRYSFSGAMPTLPIKVRDLDLSEPCLQTLKNMADAFCFVFFNYNNTIYLQSRNKGPFDGIGPVTDDSPISFEEVDNPVTLAAVKTTMDYSVIHDNQVDYNLPKADTRRFEAGARSANDSKNFVIDITAFSQKCYADAPSSGANWFPAAPPNSVSDPADRPFEIRFGIAGLGGDFDVTESGMILFYESLSERRQWYTIITLEDDENYCCAVDNGKTSADVRLDTNFYVVRKHGVLPLGTKTYRLFKSYAIAKTAAAAYAEAMLGEKFLRVREKTFRLPYYNISYDGDNYFFEKISYDFNKGACEYDAKSLRTGLTVASGVDSPPNQSSVGYIDDGNYKVGASVIYNHINDGGIHLRKSPLGVTYAKLTTEDGDVFFLYLKKVKGRLLLVIDDPSAPD